MSTPGFSIEHDEQRLLLRFVRPRPVLSCAVLNGGRVEADALLNARVPANFGEHCDDDFPDPRETLAQLAAAEGLSGTTVGMMTAASMNSYRLAERCEQGVTVSALVTAGLSNALRAGDPAGWRQIGELPRVVGTINLLLLTDIALSEAAMVEALQVATEAKAGLLQQHAVRSIESGEIATGTGTDAIAIVGGHGPRHADYCGKHTLLGEIIADTVMRALGESLSWYRSRAVAG